MNITRRMILTGAFALMATSVVPVPIVADEWTDSQGVLQGGWRYRKYAETENP